MIPGPLFSDPTSPLTTRSATPAAARLDPVQVLDRLRTGNFRFALGSSRPASVVDLRPYAVVVSCLDARVPVEAVFDQNVGTVCVVRSAGHILDRAILGSVEFAVTDLNVSLVLVLGHDDCRAVAATLDATRRGNRPAGTRGYLIGEIAPAVADVGPAHRNLEQVTAAHVRRTVARLRQDEQLAKAVTAHRIDIHGALYRLSSGHVEFL